MLGFCPAQGGSIRDSLAPFPAAQMPLGRQKLATRTGSHTGWHLLSHWGENEGHRRNNNHQEFGRGVSVVSLGAQGGFLGLTVSPTNPRTNSWFKKRERERRDAASFLPPPHPPCQSSCLDSVKPPAVPAPGGRSIVGMSLKGSKKRAPRSNLVLQCLCSIPTITSHSPKTSLTHPLLASRGLG